MNAAVRVREQESFVLIVDVQGRLVPHVEGASLVIARCALLARAALRLGVPLLATEHCPAALGPLTAELRALMPSGTILAKTHFSAQDDAGCAARFSALGRRQAVVTGMEAQVCVLQSVFGLLQAGYTVFVVDDAIGSRSAEAKAAALHRMHAAGAQLVTSEMVVFEWLDRADRAEFRELLELVK